MSAQEIVSELPSLSAEERARIAEALRDLGADAQPAPLPQANLHAGAWQVADDFDDPLPDSFWLGEDA